MMIKGHIHTFFSIIFAIAFIYGSMLCMNVILKQRQNAFLNESGVTTVQTPVKAWQELADNEADSYSKNDNSTEVLSSAQIKDAVDSWNNRSADVLHSPVKGQISMEEAIDNGKEWLKNMGVDGVTESYVDEKVVNEAKTGQGSLSVEADTVAYATLSYAITGTGDKQVELSKLAEPYNSFWTVQLEKTGINAVLYVNAVTGSVWGAELNEKYNSGEFKPDYNKIEKFWNLAGMESTDSDWLNVSEKDTKAIYESSAEPVYAVMNYKRHYMNTVVSEYTKEKKYIEYVTVEYRLETK